ncbi:RNase P subunit p30 family protein [Haloarcula marismortui]|uniref:Ribonuclease P protein component 3 n=1 Tax=Haloarcula marismortui ATCC 33800 TaxID=662476 RepID=M0K2K0_9EURY|nr:RNase P subunit p30 family protein [Haloarcula sinaiiensis]EMA14075.1 ribonuclease P subunit p30 [Haloarcula sinaiiensis ATCC 33800]QUJ73027.1 RNase P subunit p30 family protein [Haloarcula sinaiiensis ATCC 33800]
MYEAVYAHPDGDSTVARHALTAADSEYDGIVVRNHGDEQADYDADAISDAYGVDVAAGIEVRADDPSRASGFVGNYRSDRTVVVVHGGDRRINRFAVEQPTVDVLAHPMRDDGDFNHVLANAAADNGVRVEFDFGPVLRASGGSRVRAIKELRKLRELVANAGAPFVVSASPSTHLQIRAPRDIIAVGETIGFDADTVREGLTEWGQIVERNRERQSGAVIEPGVRLEDDADDAE